MKPTPPKKTRPKKLIESQNLFPVVGVGASAGGLDAFRKLLKAIPEDSGMAYVLVQHLDPSHQSLLPEILQKTTTIPVLEITDDMKVEPNHIYVIPSNKMMVATDGVLLLSPRVQRDKNSPPGTRDERNLPIDLFFTSLAEVHQTHAIGVVLSGTATDGTMGLKAIKDHGGITVAQEESSAEYEGMPNSAVQAGVVDFILPPEEIPQKLLDITQKIFFSDKELEDLPQQDESVFKQILSLLRIRKGVDFTHYKQTTVRRRILRRMVVNKNEEPIEYLRFLRVNNAEQDLLYQDMLIPVTSFFRDKKVFESLSTHVFPAILKNKIPGEVTRIWVAGCSTGQEVFSFAICFKEFLGEGHERIQIFGTDLSEPAITKARSGIYEKAELEGVSPQRLQEFFTKTNGQYTINKSIRDMCVFAHHNFLKDPPFGKMDFISCRNVLIYMEAYLQKKALTTFHYALNPKGFLLLGKSETTGGMPDLFAPVGKADKLFTRKDAPGRFIQVTSQRSEQILSRANNHSKIEALRTDFQKTADDILLTKYTPAGVVVNEAMDIVHFRGSTGNYLEQAPGKPSHNLLMMAKHGLAFELRNILHKVKTEKKAVSKENIPLHINGALRNISVEAIPLPNTLEPYFLILFHDNNISEAAGAPVRGKRKASPKVKQDEKDTRIQLLGQELSQVREDMRSITEDQEAVNEELQSANEELLSGSEELQSLNEELETSKEELQSTNEELTVLNHELLNLNEQVTTARDFSDSIIATLHQPLLVLDKNLRVKTANKAFYKTFKVSELETEDVLIYDLGNRQWNIPELRTLLEEILPQKSEITDFEVTHNFSAIGERVIILNALEILRERKDEKLILLSIDDVTERKIASDRIKESEKQFRQMADLMPQKIWTADAVGNKNYFNQKWLDYTGLNFDELKDWGWEKIVHPDDLKETKKRWELSINTGKDYEMENRLRKKDGTYLWHLTRAVALKDEDGEVKSWIGSKTEIQERQEKKEELEKAVADRTSELQIANEELIKINNELEAFVYVSSHDLQEPLRKIQTFAGIILEKENENLSEKGKNYFRLMGNAASRMQRLIEDLLAFSQLTTDERKFELTDLNTIVEAVQAEFKELMEEKRATIEVTNLGSVNVIAFQFHQLMGNLIGNALKFSKPYDPLRIEITSSMVKGKNVKNLLPDKTYCHITVADNGIGFEEEYSEKIFEVFQRLHGKEEYSGSGIGLAIVRKIVDNHNGIITATGKLNEGTTFDIYLPT